MSRALAILTALIVTALGGTAAAYPHFQLSSGTVRCSACHVGPAGGGPLKAWGRDELGDTLARGGDGGFLHGAVTLPDRLLVGGDVRVAGLANSTGTPDGGTLAVFPMQADVSAAVTAGPVQLVITAGLRGIARTSSPQASDIETLEGPSAASYLVSREHYALYQPADTGVYARAGRFAAPYGLRLVDHTQYVRRYLGFNLLEETYGASGGFVDDDWEAHVTAFTADPLQYAGPGESGLAAMVELHTSTAWLVGLSTRLATGDTTRLAAGVHGKLLLDGPALLLQAEVDGVRQMFDDGGDRTQLLAHVGPVWMPTRGVYVGVAYQAFAEDLAYRAVTRHAGEASVSVLPTAHVEVALTGRAQWIGPQQHATTALLQLHYNL